VSGAFLLVPWQVTVLDRTGASVSSTSLVFNLITTPVAVARASGHLDRTLAARVLTGSIPGVVGGVLLRTYGLTASRPFLLLASAVLGLVALRLARYTPLERVPAHRGEPSTAAIVGWGGATALLGGAYGVGGGSLLAPILVVLGLSIPRVSGATLLATGVTSAVGLVAYLALAAAGEPTAPDWDMGLAFGVGGAAGALTGTVVQRRFSERTLRGLLTGLTMLAAAATLGRAIAG
jgi:uncharacterized membrane protein YfcA